MIAVISFLCRDNLTNQWQTNVTFLWQPDKPMSPSQTPCLSIWCADVNPRFLGAFEQNDQGFTTKRIAWKRFSVQNSPVTEVASLSIEHLCFGLGLGLCCWSYFSLGLGLSLCFVFHYHLFWLKAWQYIFYLPLEKTNLLVAGGRYPPLGRYLLTPLPTIP